MAVMVLLAAYVASPLHTPRPGASERDARTALLQARRESVEQTLRDLSQDAETGLLGPDEHQRQLGEAESERDAIVRELDASGPRAGPSAD